MKSINCADSDLSKRENSLYYIPLCDSEKSKMLAYLKLRDADELFAHIPESIRQNSAIKIDEALSTNETRLKIRAIAGKNRAPKISFLGDEAGDWRVSNIANEISKIRGLTTAYTPYQPERSQGTLISHWIYECAMASLTGFEAVNCSLYDGATALFEAITCALRLAKKTKAILCESILPNQIEVARTLANGTDFKIALAKIDKSCGKVTAETLAQALLENPDAGCIAFPQTNAFGIIEDADMIADFAHKNSLKSIAIIDPMLLAPKALKEPAKYGANGVDIVIGEARHLYSAPNLGGLGLGIFAVRTDGEHKNDIRQAAGRFVGKAKDLNGADCFAMVLATREQHIRHEKATSNICSNEAFMATLAGACILEKSGAGLEKSAKKARDIAMSAFEKITQIAGFSYPFGTSAFFNEFTVKCPVDVDKIINYAAAKSVHIGANVSGRCGLNKNLLRLSFTDKNSLEQLDILCEILVHFADGNIEISQAPKIAPSLLRESDLDLPKLESAEILEYYKALGALNISPDDACYPLGSCTMKYNPLLNDELATLEDFELMHPQSPIADIQGSLEILWIFQEKMKAITMLDAVACQPVAGAQGELCALKMIQAYQRDNSPTLRDTVFIPATAHGTNFASAAMAGFKNIVRIDPDESAQLSMQSLAQNLQKYKGRVAAIMITNPNTSGIFETRFKEIADLVHAEGGLVFMDGANFNAVAGQINLKAMGVDAIHNNLHKTWSIAHGGGGAGDAFVAVEKKLADYIPSYIVEKSEGKFLLKTPSKSIGSLHAHFGNFPHKVRALAYIYKLGAKGVKAMSQTAVLASRYLYETLKTNWKTLPENCINQPRMHEFIIALCEDDFKAFESTGVTRQLATARTGKMFLDYGFHAPTVSFPEVFGLMIEPTESYTKAELDRFRCAINSIQKTIRTNPARAAASPRLMPVCRIDETSANRAPIFSEKLTKLPELPKVKITTAQFAKMTIDELEKI